MEKNEMQTLIKVMDNLYQQLDERINKIEIYEKEILKIRFEIQELDETRQEILEMMDYF